MNVDLDRSSSEGAIAWQNSYALASGSKVVTALSHANGLVSTDEGALGVYQDGSSLYAAMLTSEGLEISTLVAEEVSSRSYAVVSDGKKDVTLAYASGSVSAPTLYIRKSLDAGKTWASPQKTVTLSGPMLTMGLGRWEDTSGEEHLFVGYGQGSASSGHMYVAVDGQVSQLDLGNTKAAAASAPNFVSLGELGILCLWRDDRTEVNGIKLPALYMSLWDGSSWSDDEEAIPYFHADPSAAFDGKYIMIKTHTDSSSEVWRALPADSVSNISFSKIKVLDTTGRFGGIASDGQGTIVVTWGDYSKTPREHGKTNTPEADADRRLGISVSRDHGETWYESSINNDTAQKLAHIAWLPDGSMGLMWEDAKTHTIRFVVGQ